tara:strand:- start:341 stop:682 length:342 start_codon:yes stop_codon:yes gene_type:complete
MAAIVNFNIEQGTTFTTDVTVTDNAGDTFDLSDYSAFGALSKGVSSFYTRTQFTTSITTPTTGVVTLDLTADQTAALEEGRYLFDVEIIKGSDSTVTRVIEGIITVRPRAARP